MMIVFLFHQIVLCGNGVIPLILSLRTDKKIVGVELQKKLANLAIKSVEYNDLESQIEILNINMKDYVNTETMEKYDLITCNPPYFKVNEENYFNLSLEKVIARHEVEVTLDDVFCISKKLLKIVFCMLTMVYVGAACPPPAPKPEKK